MNLVDRFILFFAPHLLLKKQELAVFRRDERMSVRNIMRSILPVVGVGYILHYFFFDIPMGLAENSLFWFYFRFGMTVACVLGTAFYWSVESVDSKLFRLPGLFICTAIIQLQNIATILYPDAPILYPYVFMLVSIFSLRLTTLQNILFTGVNLYFTTVLLLETPNKAADIYSASLVAAILWLMLFNRNYTAIQLFKFNLEKLDTQKQLIEQQIELTNHMRGFLPRRIYDRFQELLQRQKLSSTYALDEILRAQTKPICCLFSDIRGYTQHSRNQSFLGENIIPMIRRSSEVVEDHMGIPRKIGDLIFAYFDEDSEDMNGANVLSAAREMAKIDLSEDTKSKNLSRSIIVSYGEAIVGNLGGADSSIEITAMGNPSNECARLDEFIKKNPVFNDKVIFSDSFFQRYGELINFDYEVYQLAKDEQVRDFEGIRVIYHIDFENIQKLAAMREGA